MICTKKFWLFFKKKHGVININSFFFLHHVAYGTCARIDFGQLGDAAPLLLFSFPIVYFRPPLEKRNYIGLFKIWIILIYFPIVPFVTKNWTLSNSMKFIWNFNMSLSILESSPCVFISSNSCVFCVIYPNNHSCILFFSVFFNRLFILLFLVESYVFLILVLTHFCVSKEALR